MNRPDPQPMLKIHVIPVTPFAQNCSIIMCTQTNAAAVVDPGGDVDVIMQAVRQMNANVEQILLTHGHLDHAAGAPALAAALQSATGHVVPIIGPHSADQYWLDDLPARARAYGFGEAKAFAPTRYLQDGDEIQIGAQRLQVLHCPGHTPGHVVFFHEGMRVAWVGDVLFKGSIGRTDFPGGNHGDLIAAINTKLLPLGDDVQFISGHGAMSTLGHERLNNPFLI